MKTRPCPCPECGTILDAATGAFAAEIDHQRITDLKTLAPEATPEAGSLTICIKCTQFLIFDQNLILQPLSHQQYLELPDDLRSVLHRIRRVIHDHPAGEEHA